MRRFIVLVPLLLVLCSCLEQEVESIAKNTDSRRSWVFVQFNVPDETDKLDSYYYYGSISSSLYHEIANNRLNSGFIYLRNVKYWGKDDLIYEFEDGESSGDLIFRIEDIRKMELIKKEPQAGKGAEQFEEPVQTEDIKEEEI